MAATGKLGPLLISGNRKAPLVADELALRTDFSERHISPHLPSCVTRPPELRMSVVVLSPGALALLPGARLGEGPQPQAAMQAAADGPVAIQAAAGSQEAAHGH